MKLLPVLRIKKIYAKIKSRVTLLAFKHSTFPISRLVLKLSGFEDASPIALRKNCSTLQIAKVADSSNYKVIIPDFDDTAGLSSLGHYQPIYAYKLRSAIISAYSPIYSTHHRLIFPDFLIDKLGRVQTASSCLYRQAGSLFRVTQPSQRIKQGIHVSGAGAFNWFHFVLECLPKVLLADALPGYFREYPLIAPIECKRVDSFSRALNLVSKGRPTCFLEHSQLALVDELVVFDEISTAPFNMTDGCWPELADYQQHDSIILNLIAELRSTLVHQANPQCEGKRIFLVRSNGRRSYNQDELVEIASRYAFEPVSPELLPLEEQASLFNMASMIIGASGAAWVGMIFAKRPIAGLSWLPAEYKEFCSYSTLASLLGHTLKFIECTPSRKLISTGDAYNATYTVNPKVFEDSLRKLISRFS